MKIKSFLIIAFLLAVTILPGNAQIEISREILFRLPADLSFNLLGMRVSAGKAVIMNRQGKMVRVDLETKEALKGRIRGRRPVDFDLVLGQPVFIDDEGMLGGQVQSEWPRESFSACKIEAANEGVILSGGGKMLFLANNATESFRVDDFHFALPFRDGFLWSAQMKKPNGIWGVSLYDFYGNLMKNVYEFSPSFDPAGLEIGPLGEEGEVIISAYENNRRKISMIGQNGHMMWKIDGPEKVCARDIAVDGQGNLLVLEESEEAIILSRWKFQLPQG